MFCMESCNAVKSFVEIMLTIAKRLQKKDYFCLL